VQSSMHKFFKAKNPTTTNNLSSKLTQQKWKNHEKSLGLYQKDFEKRWSEEGDKMQIAANNNDQRTVYQLLKLAIGATARPLNADVCKFAKEVEKKCMVNSTESVVLSTTQNRYKVPEPTFEE
jgi:long-subunit acyl-CoA synthetase (AMP-forming)